MDGQNITDKAEGVKELHTISAGKVAQIFGEWQRHGMLNNQSSTVR